MNNLFFAMNENTYDDFKESGYKLAFEKKDPIEYIMKFFSVEVKINNDLEDGMIEVYEINIPKDMGYESQMDLIGEEDWKDLFPKRNEDDDE